MRDIGVGAAHVRSIAYDSVPYSAGQVINRLGDANADVLWCKYVAVEVAWEGIEDEIAGARPDRVDEMSRKFFPIGDGTRLL